MMNVLYLSTSGDDTIVLPNPLEFYDRCALVEINGKISPRKKNGNLKDSNNNNLYLCCNIVEESLVGKVKMPVLRVINRKNGTIINEINNLLWLKVMRPNILSIRLYICDEFGEIVSVARNKLNCTLVFEPN